ncbi:MAG: hypothetical protein COW79_13900 [Bdellovibrionales bacterium CG22_combo_CG10-13_8_21_14_all_38_13]|nr:MAG: hypothetical protein COW79_13900 [Bdellovibrionales bacterium CG22_combo_CG10-13_8_21_14_all_38_13]
MTFAPFVLALTLILSLTSCGGIQKMAVGTTAGLLFDAAYEMETEPDWDHLKESVGPNLKVVEGLYSLSPEDDDLLVALVKGYTAYAFAIHETEALADQYSDKSKSISLSKAQHFYSRAIEYGLEYFVEQGITWDQLVKSPREEGGVEGLLSKKLSSDKRTHEAVAFFAQAMGGLINLKKDDMTLVAQLGIVKGMFDWVCKEDPNINHGACQLFYAAYEAGRPRMLGGDPEKGREIFKKAIELNPNNWLVHVTYLQYYVIPMGDEDEWASVKKVLNQAEVLNQEDLIWSPGAAPNAAFKDKSIRAFQAVALKRWSIIKKYEKEFF